MQKWLPLFVFVIILGVARIVGAQTGELANFQPFGALFFCGMVFYGMKGLWAPALAWIISYPLTNALNGFGWSAQLFIPIVGFAVIVACARFFKGKSTGTVILGSLASAVGFYLLTNTLSWAFDPGYVKSFSGWSQALFTGLPGFPPTWTFFRNSLIAQGLFSIVFLLAHANLPALLPQKTARPSEA